MITCRKLSIVNNVVHFKEMRETKILRERERERERESGGGEKKQ